MRAGVRRLGVQNSGVARGCGRGWHPGFGFAGVVRAGSRGWLAGLGCRECWGEVGEAWRGGADAGAERGGGDAGARSDRIRGSRNRRCYR